MTAPPHPVHTVTTFDRRFSDMPRKKQPSTFTPPKPATTQRFEKGDRVEHALFGSGTILEAKAYGSDTLYVIRFDHVGEKKLMATYAKLKKND